ncbi:hypothetical protein L228DRAFT_51640 [Xylona heveae TC161]|uniref:Uncharacterized protein n=1 Tax=Xylona heveae (strain CBS 132557 / TC161) TaxID=1328760 RepID=A0A164ZDN6_XYLHT|nr:hypothetical protein L228DRAFT_51640 [Xylona heveae TC161]KZF18970.1 hypothetical protein L228DRAFT_51640 [Xylona heveae TC161]
MQYCPGSSFTNFPLKLFHRIIATAVNSILAFIAKFQQDIVYYSDNRRSSQRHGFEEKKLRNELRSQNNFCFFFRG